MLVTPSSTLKGIAEVLEKEIIPDLNSNYPKAQSHAIVSMLRNLAVWEEKREDFLSKENSELEQLLRKARIVLRSQRRTMSKKAKSLQRRLNTLLSSKGEGASMENYNQLLRELLDDTILFVASEPSSNSGPSLSTLREEIRGALRKRIKAEMNFSLPSKMAEFSKGD